MLGRNKTLRELVDVSASDIYVPLLNKTVSETHLVGQSIEAFIANIFGSATPFAKIVSNENTLALFAAASDDYTFVEGDVIIIVTADNIAETYIYVGGTKTNVVNYINLEDEKSVYVTAKNGAVNYDGDLQKMANLPIYADNAAALTGGLVEGQLYINNEREVKTVVATYVGKRVYKALISQSGTNAPTAVILENTLGEVPTFSYAATGRYRLLTSASILDINKINIICQFAACAKVSFRVESTTSLLMQLFDDTFTRVDDLIPSGIDVSTLTIEVYL